MNYIYAELNKNLIPKELGVYYGFSVEVPNTFPINASVCDDYSHLRAEGWCKQKYSLSVYEDPKYPYFIYPIKYGELKHVEVNQVYDIFMNWDVKQVVKDNITYNLCVYKNMIAPGMEIEYTFKIKSEEDAD